MTVHAGRQISIKQARKRRRSHGERGQTALDITSVLYVSIYNIFPYFLYILNICLTVFTFCSTNRGLLWLCGLGRDWGGTGKGAGGVGSIYILERCLHISKSYVSCLGKSMTLYFIYLLKYLGLTRVFTFSIRS